MFKVSGVVVLYNPDEEVVENISSYINQINMLVAVDNSDNANKSVLEKIKNINNVFYIKNDGNEGMAKALNMGAKKAIEEGSDYLLTMDQDDKVTPNMILKMFECVKDKDLAKIGIIAPFYRIKENHLTFKEQCEEVLTVMTSGNILNLKAYRTIGQFNEELFLDYTDHEYCLRLNLAGYKIVQINNVILDHKIGTITKHRFFFKAIHTTNHLPIRRYYTTRNRFYIYKKYNQSFPTFCRNDKKEFVIELIKILLFERQKINKFKMIIRGFKDFKNGKYDKYS